ncbi:proteasome adapter and scaffold protein ECM29 isoform X4 [Rhipicephalus microplus]|uniref:proteasome adapter and scaffold protein ECM29 isoform X4 n=1 Tax=Rhipicephalus microplus TaxID=6941 RepID=UPI003F6A82AE
MAEADVPNEAVLVERVFLRFVTAESDEQFESVLSKFLLPVLGKLSSPHESIRKKVMELLVHVNKRLKSRPQVQLPVEALLTHYAASAGGQQQSSFFVNFALVYLRMGFPRLPSCQQVELLPRLMECLTLNKQHQDEILNLALGAIPHVVAAHQAVGGKGPALPVPLGQSEAWALLRDRLLDLLLLPYGSPVDGGKSAPPGLSMTAVSCLQGCSPEELEQRKMAVVQLLADGGLYPEHSVVLHLLVAAADTRHSVAGAAELKMKTLATALDWNDETFVNGLYNLYLGSCVPVASSTVSEQSRTPADTRLRLKILPCLTKSSRAASMLPLALMVTFDTLNSPGNAKLKGMALEFIQAVCNNNPEDKLSMVGGQLMATLLQLALPSQDMDMRLRVLACSALGHLSRKLPRLVANDLSLVQTLFNGLAKEESSEGRLALQEALVAVGPAYAAWADNDTRQMLLALVSTHGSASSANCRHAALRYAATVYAADYAPARYLLLMAAGDSQEEIRREALKALYPAAEASTQFPPFTDMLQLVLSKLPQHDSIHYLIGDGTFWPSCNEVRRVTKGRSLSPAFRCGVNEAGATASAGLPHVSSLPWSQLQYSQVLRYLRRCLHASAGVTGAPDERSLRDSTGAPRVCRYLHSLAAQGDKKPELYAQLLVRFLPLATDEGPLVSLVELVASAAPDQSFSLLEAGTGVLKGLLLSGREAVRECAAQLVGLLMASHPPDTFRGDLQALCTDIRRKTEGGSLEGRQSSLLVLAHALCRRHQAGLGLEGVAEAITLLADTFLQAQQSCSWPLVLPSCVALGQLGAALALPLPPGQVEGGPPATQGALVYALTSLLHNAKAPSKCREEAARTLGLLCLGQPDFPHVHQVLTGLLKCGLVESADVEVHFTVGESLCCAVLGKTSPLCRDPWTTEEAEYKPPVGATANLCEMEWLMSQLLDNYLCHPRPGARQAACVWTLSLLKRCSQQSPVLLQLEHAQAALLNLLADRSELTQSLASKCLSLLYELSDQANREQLVAQLLDTLTSGRKSTVEITEDTRLFDEGTLGSTPTGGSLTTYRELCSVATDLNQPDLMYKFMHLANHHALWNSKKGAAFGFGSIADKAGEQLKEHLGAIVPKLYRYRYDPNPSVRASFGSIWAALVKEPVRTVDLYFKEIMVDVMQHLTSNEWRVRESSCLALSDLLSGRNLDNVLDHVPDLWESLFRVQDDIKESVRKASESSLRALTKACVRTCDAQAKGREHALGVIIPSVAKGLSSSVAEARHTSLDTLVQLSRSAGPALRPHLALLFGALLDALSELESPVLNQLSVRADADERDRLDAARVAASRTSPAMETINYCVQFVDASVLPELVPRLVEQSKSAVGLGTKAGCCHLATTLAHQCPLDLEPFTGKLLRAFVRGLSDRNATVRRCCATAVGHLSKVAKESDVDRLFTKLQMWYMEGDDEVVQWACAYTMQAVARHAPDRLRAHAASALPLAFFAKHSTPPEGKTRDESPSAVWEEVWVEFTTGDESGVRLYLNEVLSLVNQALASAVWSLRRQGAAASCSVARTLGAALEWRLAETLIQSLLAALPGRTWQGKEALLKALSIVCSNCIAGPQVDGGRPSAQQALLNEVSEAFLRECRRDNRTYREQAVCYLAQLLQAQRLDRFGPLLDVLEGPLLKYAASRSGEAAEDDQEAFDLELQLQFQEVAFNALGQAWPQQAPDTQEKYRGRLCDLLLSNFSGGTWKVQLAIIKALHTFVLRLSWPVQASEEVVSMVNGIVQVACEALDTQTSWIVEPSFKKLRHMISTVATRDNMELKNLAQEVADILATFT